MTLVLNNPRGVDMFKTNQRTHQRTNQPLNQSADWNYLKLVTISCWIFLKS